MGHLCLLVRNYEIKSRLDRGKAYDTKHWKQGLVNKISLYYHCYYYCFVRIVIINIIIWIYSLYYSFFISVFG